MSESTFEAAPVAGAVAGSAREAVPRSDGGDTPTRATRIATAGQAETLFALARRHDLPFSVVVVRPLGHTPAATAREIVEAETRLTDLLLVRADTGSIVVSCPATPAEGVPNLVRRIRARAGGLLIGIGSASFRDDGYTFDDLVIRAAQRERSSRPHPNEGDGVPPRHGLRVMPLLYRSRQRSRASRVLKRVFDLAAVVAAAPLWLPVVAVVALAVKASDVRAPVLFVQQRTGLHGRPFAFYKFRTMVRDAEQRKARLGERNERAWPDFKIEADPRITRIGRWLRSTSLDELPQLWNVLRGEMSLVGPRPTSFPAETYQAWQTARLEAVPGLTGLWQVEARNCSDFAERIRLDLRYVENQSFLYDLTILLRTVPAVLWHRDGR